MSLKGTYSDQCVELTLKSRAVGSRHRTLTRAVRVDEKGAYVRYRNRRVDVRQHGKDGIDWVGTIQL